MGKMRGGEERSSEYTNMKKEQGGGGKVEWRGKGGRREEWREGVRSRKARRGQPKGKRRRKWEEV